MDEKQATMQAAADRLSAKLRAFNEALPDDEKQVMAYILRHMATQADERGRRMTAKMAFEMPDDADPVR
jgi:hypothetical protein